MFLNWFDAWGEAYNGDDVHLFHLHPQEIIKNLQEVESRLSEGL